MQTKLFLLCLATGLIIAACNRTPTTDPSGPSKQNKQLLDILTQKFEVADYPLCYILESIHTSLDGQTDSIFTYVNGEIYKRQIIVFWKSGNITKSLYYKTGSENLDNTPIETFEQVSADTNLIHQPGIFAELADAKNKMSAPLNPRQGIPDKPKQLYFIFDFKDITHVLKFESDHLYFNTDHAATQLYFRITPSGLLSNNPTY
jgi:hypothetical protein